MLKHPTISNPSIYNLICIFNSISKCSGFAVTKSDDTLLSKSLREIVFFLLVLFALLCTIRAELWYIKILGMGFDVRKVVVFTTTQMINASPLGCLFYFRLCDCAVWKIILKVKHLEELMILCNMYLEIGRIGSYGLFFWFFHFFVITSMMYYTLWPTVMFILLDSVCIFYFEAWIAIPYLQFLVWIWFLDCVSYCVQLKIIEINKLKHLTMSNFCRCDNRFYKALWCGYGFDERNQFKKIIVVLKQVLNIASDLSAVYGVTVLLYIVCYLSRVILQFYDLIDKDAQKFPAWLGILNTVVRIAFILPVFIFCERLSYNVNRAVELIQEIVTLHQPSCLDCIFQSLTLRLQHQKTTTTICGFLNITYSSFLTIMTTALAFLLFQLQL